MTSGGAGQELEIKLALSAEQYQRLLTALPGRVGQVSQRNLFLDTADRQLATRRVALRLRHETPQGSESQVIVTVKGPSTRLVGAVQRTEVEALAAEPLWHRALRGPLPAEAIEGAPGDFLRQSLAPDAALSPVITLDNRRTTFGVSLAGSRHLVELDRTQFATGEVDHELELELEPLGDPPSVDSVLEIRAVTKALEQLLTDHGIDAERSARGKFSRALLYAGRR